MRKKQTNQVLQFLLALALPLVAIGAGLQSCSDDGPGIPHAEDAEEVAQVRNPLMRSPEEAIDIAQRAWEDFYGDESSAASRSGRRCVIDYGRPVEVIKGAKSRGGSGQDTLLYVVNFADDAGFAVIAAPRHVDELLAVTSQGHYYPESQPDQEKVPGFEMWMENARAYAAITYPCDSTDYPIHPGIDTTIVVGPINPPGGDMPPVTRDSTNVVNPNDPGQGLLQQKEWEDTTYQYIFERQLPGSWGQGGAVDDLYNAPESYYFRNGYCGCATVAIAQICAYYREPSRVYLIRPGVGQLYSLDWDKMVKHRVYHENEFNHVEWSCKYEDVETSHIMIAKFCKAIADRSDATLSSDGTSISAKKALESLKSLLSRNVSSDWIEYTSYDYPGKGQLFLMLGDNINPNEAGHAWVCDGTRYVEYIHYYATRPNSSSQWQIQSSEPGRSIMLHYNWGWYGLDNGWFNQKVISAGGNTFKNFKYVRIS